MGAPPSFTMGAPPSFNMEAPPSFTMEAPPSGGSGLVFQGSCVLALANTRIISGCVKAPKGPGPGALDQRDCAGLPGLFCSSGVIAVGVAALSVASTHERSSLDPGSWG